MILKFFNIKKFVREFNFIEFIFLFLEGVNVYLVGLLGELIGVICIEY